MKLRMITLGINLDKDRTEEQIKAAGNFLSLAKKVFEEKNYPVQTLRLATQPWEEYYSSLSQIKSLVRHMSDLTQQNEIDFFSLGPASSPELVPLSVELVGSSRNGFCTASAAGEGQIYYRTARSAAAVIKKLTRQEEKGFANLRFAVIFNTGAGSPFFPASYHHGPPTFSIGTENSDLVYLAFQKAGSIEAASGVLQDILDSEFQTLEKTAFEIEKQSEFNYGGVDVSIAPSIKKEESLAFAFEKLQLGKFGGPGTLAAAAKVTECLKNVPVRKCGYSGLMLPVLEDYGLALRNSQGYLDIMKLLQYSAVCGTGLDTIPLPGDAAEEEIYALLLDIAALSVKYNKPLSARLMPVPGKEAGEMTEYEFEYFVNTKIMPILGYS